MSESSDHDLIGSYARNRSDDVFAALVQRHVDLVYSTALRIVRDTHLAEDVTQRVFVALDQQAVRLRNRTALSGWLHETARNFAISTVRSEQRRRLRELEAVSMNVNDSTATNELWVQVEAQLDDVLAELREKDRDVILWRYFERKTAEQVGERLGLSSEAAQKRIVRALDRLRSAFAERGVATPATGLAVLLSTQAIQAAPAGLAPATIASIGVTGSALSVNSVLGAFLGSTKIKIGIAAMVAASITLPLLQQYRNSQPHELAQATEAQGESARAKPVRRGPAKIAEPLIAKSPKIPIPTRAGPDQPAQERRGSARPIKQQFPQTGGTRNESAPRPARVARSDRDGEDSAPSMPVRTQ
ncbi:MAG: sigma-70 family RNA polymerase sigma factor [Verrucomicrobiales bacterium]|nr:sigma-70 family RNA polymerase sigma factor [Verrucomicrobiales bacterium]